MYVIDDVKLRDKFDRLLGKSKPSSSCDLTRTLNSYNLQIKSEISENIMIKGPLYPLIVICKGMLNLSSIGPTSQVELSHVNDCFTFDLSFLESDSKTFLKHDEYIKLFESKYGIKVDVKFFIKENMKEGDRFNRRICLGFKTDTLKNYKEFN